MTDLDEDYKTVNEGMTTDTTEMSEKSIIYWLINIRFYKRKK